MGRPKTFLLTAIAFRFFVALFHRQFNPYFLFISYDVGINIIPRCQSQSDQRLHPGQFSLGHAGFMAVGAYTSAVITTKIGERSARCWGSGSLGPLFLAALIAGIDRGLLGPLGRRPFVTARGIIWPSLRSVSQIIRVLVQNMHRSAAHGA
jgi:branched-chain amino acid transport system permease protein